MTAPTIEVLEEIDGHPTCIRVRPHRAYQGHVDVVEAPTRSDTSATVIRFTNALSSVDGLWTHCDLFPNTFRRVEARVVPTVTYERWKPEVKAPRVFTIAIDFDNVVHSYTSPWSASADISDPPLPGAIEWLERLAAEGARIILHTCRFTQWNPEVAGFIAGDPQQVEAAVWDWLTQHGLSDAACERVSMWTWVGKPYADAYVDDKAIAFTGEYYGADSLRDSVAFHKRQRIETLGA